MLFTVALAISIAKVFSRTTEAELAAAHVQRTLRTRLGSKFTTFSRGVALAEATVAAVRRSVSVFLADQLHSLGL
jgi:hypothetical protein